MDLNSNGLIMRTRKHKYKSAVSLWYYRKQPISYEYQRILSWISSRWILKTKRQAYWLSKLINHSCFFLFYRQYIIVLAPRRISTNGFLRFLGILHPTRILLTISTNLITCNPKIPQWKLTLRAHSKGTSRLQNSNEWRPNVCIHIH